jgi:hypothetical protein
MIMGYDCPPEGSEDAVPTILQQCELWADYSVV